MAREKPEDKLIRMTARERELWACGRMVAGIDEVGRGPLCGPVVSGCVIIGADALIPGVDDSKKLSAPRREALYGELIARASYARTAFVPAEDIDRINILAATKLSMARAAEGAIGAYFLVDAVTGLLLPGESESIIHGDATSYMIAAASIIAKVERDRYMERLHEMYPMYNLASNKGYGTKEHIEAIHKYGPCPEHRISFLGRILSGVAQ